MSGASLSIEQILVALAETPPRITTHTAGLAPAQLQMAPTSAEWSINHVLAHLRACSDVWGSCIEAIITQDKPTLHEVKARVWIKQTNVTPQPSKGRKDF